MSWRSLMSCKNSSCCPSGSEPHAAGGSQVVNLPQRGLTSCNLKQAPVAWSRMEFTPCSRKSCMRWRVLPPAKPRNLPPSSRQPPASPNHLKQGPATPCSSLITLPLHTVGSSRSKEGGVELKNQISFSKKRNFLKNWVKITLKINVALESC